MAGYTSGIDLTYDGGNGLQAYDFLDDSMDRAGFSFMQPISEYSGYGGSVGGTDYAPYVRGAGTLIGAYTNASTDSTGSALEGAASGAMAGASFGPVGAVVGGVLGAISGYFGSKGKKKQQKEEFEMKKQLAVAQIQEQEKNYQLHQQQTKDALANYIGTSPYQFKNPLLSPFNQQAPQQPQQAAPNQQVPSMMNPVANDPNQLAQQIAQQRQAQLGAALGMYQGMQYG